MTDNRFGLLNQNGVTQNAAAVYKLTDMNGQQEGDIQYSLADMNGVSGQKGCTFSLTDMNGTNRQ